MFNKLLQAVLPQDYRNRQKAARDEKEWAEWNSAGRPVPVPHKAKQMAIAEYAQRYGCTVLVETGTYLGDMLEAQKHRFQKLYSIELSVDLFHRAKRRFRNNPHITLLQGDSGAVLSTVVSQLNTRALFWLDGHYSGGITARGEKECPIYEELDAILAHPQHGHVLLIDDARLFTGKNDYPTLAELSAYFQQKDPRYTLSVDTDIIRCVV